MSIEFKLLDIQNKPFMRHLFWLLVLVGLTACEQFMGEKPEDSSETDSTEQAAPSTMDTLRLTGLASSLEQLQARFPNLQFPFTVTAEQLETWDLNIQLLDYQNAVRYLKAEAWPENQPKPNFYPLGKWEVEGQTAMLYAIQYYPQKGLQNVECHLNLYKEGEQSWTGIVGNWYYDPKGGEGSVSSFSIPKPAVLIKETILFEQESLKKERRQKAYRSKLLRITKSGVEELEEHPLLQEATFQRILPYFPELNLPQTIELPVTKTKALPSDYGTFVLKLAEEAETEAEVRSYGRFRLSNGLNLLLYGHRAASQDYWTYQVSSFKRPDALLGTEKIAFWEDMNDGRFRKRSGRIRNDNAIILTDSIFQKNELDTLIEEQLLLRSDGHFEKL